MTWEEVICKIRTEPEFKDLVTQAYFDADLTLNAERFRNSAEYLETLRLIRSEISGKSPALADIGAGNGIASIAFSLDGFKVTAIEPDPSNTIGAGAIEKLKKHYKLDELTILESKGESMRLASATFDVVYIRQAMHHADDLEQFIAEAARLLKAGGILLTTRDHVIYDEKDKQLFLETHPLHRYYGGENAFTETEYIQAFRKAGLSIVQTWNHYDSVINYFPMTEKYLEKMRQDRSHFVEQLYTSKFPALLGKLPGIKNWYVKRANRKLGPVLDERKIAGRLITFLAKKTS